MSEHGDHSGHFVAPAPLYWLVWAALIALTVITVITAKFDAIFGIDLEATIGIPYFNIGLAMLIATVKASLVLLGFMGLLWDRRLNAVVITTGFVFLGFFFLLTLADTEFRGEYDDRRGMTPKEIDGDSSPYYEVHSGEGH